MQQNMIFYSYHRNNQCYHPASENYEDSNLLELRVWSDISFICEWRSFKALETLVKLLEAQHLIFIMAQVSP